MPTYGEYRLKDGRIETRDPDVENSLWGPSAHDSATEDELPMYRDRFPDHPVLPLLEQKFAEQNQITADVRKMTEGQ
jgi:hypothetical protein